MRYVILYSVLISAMSCKEPHDITRIVAAADLIGITSITDSTYLKENNVIGHVTLQDHGTRVTLELTVNGLQPNHQHAVHLHIGSCEQPGHHWNQGTNDNFCNRMVDGEPWARPKAGDVGNVLTDENGEGSLTISTELWSLVDPDPRTILGKVILLHQNGEDFLQECFESHQHVHNNPKIACGMIELVND